MLAEGMPLQQKCERLLTLPFNSIFRTTCLDRWLFNSMTEARVVIDQWLEEYNTIRPHGSLGGMNPEQFLQRWTDGNINQKPKILTA